MLENVNQINSETMEHICVINRVIASHKFQLPQQSFDMMLKISLLGLRTQVKRITVEGLRTLESLAYADRGKIEEWAEDAEIATLCSLLDKEDKSIRDSAVKCLSAIFMSEDTAIVDKAIMEDILPRLLSALKNNQSKQAVRNILWCLSNLIGGSSSHVAAFMAHEELVAEVFQCAKAETVVVCGEAMWTICNAIRGSESSLRLFFEEHQDELIFALCEGLNNPRLTDPQLIVAMIQATDRLLCLDLDDTQELHDQTKVSEIF